MGMPESQPVNPSQRYERARADGVPQLYANGFANTLGVGDVVLVLERNDQPIAILNLSYTVAKTLSLSLSRIVTLLEERSNREIMTTHDIEAMFREETNMENDK